MHIAALKAFSLLALMAWRLKNTHIAAVKKGLATCTHGLATERYTHAHRTLKAFSLLEHTAWHLKDTHITQPKAFSLFAHMAWRLKELPNNA